MKEPWYPIVIWKEKTIILLKITKRVLLLNMSLVWITQMINNIQKKKTMVGLGLKTIQVPQIYIDLRDLVELLGFKWIHSRCSFWWVFEDRMWTILSENTNKYVHTKLKQANDNGDKDPIKLLREGWPESLCMTE